MKKKDTSPDYKSIAIKRLANWYNTLGPDHHIVKKIERGMPEKDIAEAKKLAAAGYKMS